MLEYILRWLDFWWWVPGLVLACILYPMIWWSHKLSNYKICPNCNDREWLAEDPCPECIGAPKNEYKRRLGQK